MPKVKKAVRPFVLDSETTGFEDPVCAIQVAFCEVFGDPHNCEPGSPVSYRFNPGRYIEYGAMGTHHITNEMVQKESPWAKFKFPEKADYFIGHSVGYDFGVIKAHLPKGCEPKLIDTCSLAQIVFPDCDSHKQTALAYYLWDEGLVSPTIRDKWAGLIKGAHEAVADITINYHLCRILARQMGVTSWADMSAASLRFMVPRKMTFGKHFGDDIALLPQGYKNWALKNCDDLKPEVRQALLMTDGEWQDYLAQAELIKYQRHDR